MSAEPQGSPPPDEQPATTGALVVQMPKTAQAVREVRVTTDPVPMLDTAKFEHMQRIATVMAETSMIPDSLRMGKQLVVAEDGVEKLQTVELPMRNVVANCFMVTNQAVRWGMDPFAVAQCASVVHGKLMWEGKLVAAVIDAKLGIRLRFTFTNDAPNRKPEDQSLGVIVSGHFPDEDEPRTIEGTVARWHKGAKSPWGNPLDWKRQLRYMGAREWARAHAPAVMLGVITDDEADETINAPKGPIPRRLAAPPPPAEKKTDPVADAAIGVAEPVDSKPIAVRGKRAAPPPPAEKKPEPAGDVTVEMVVSEIEAAKNEKEFVEIQRKYAVYMEHMNSDSRDAIFEAIEKATAKLSDTFPGDRE